MFHVILVTIEACTTFVKVPDTYLLSSMLIIWNYAKSSTAVSRVSFFLVELKIVSQYLLVISALSSIFQMLIAHGCVSLINTSQKSLAFSECNSWFFFFFFFCYVCRILFFKGKVLKSQAVYVGCTIHYSSSASNIPYCQAKKLIHITGFSW